MINITIELIVIVASLNLGSVSDLLDYINPSHDAKGRDSAAKRKNYTVKVVVLCHVSRTDFQLDEESTKVTSCTVRFRNG